MLFIFFLFRRVFEKISVMDMQYMDDEEEIVIPNFGNSNTDLEASTEEYYTSYVDPNS